MKGAIQISILVVSYDTRELTLECLRSLFEQTTRVPFEVIVVDNASTDGSPGAIAKSFPQVRLIVLDQNVGFAAGNNLAAREATGEFLLLLNPDTVVLDQAIERLFAFALANGRAGIFGGRTLFPDGSLNPASCWRRPTPWSMLCAGSGLSSVFPGSKWLAPESYGGWRRDTVREVDIVSGCFLMIQKELWESLGGFDPAFFMYGEEADLCLRAGKQKIRCLICPDARIVHYGGASERVRADKMVRLFKAKRLLVDRHWPSAVRWVGVAALDLWAFTRVVTFGVLMRVQSRRREAHQVWSDIWRRRGEWRIKGSRDSAQVPMAQVPRQ